MVDAHPLPPGLEPDIHEHGLASSDLATLAAALLVGCIIRRNKQI